MRSGDSVLGMKKIAIIISTPPYGNVHGREALDMALALSLHHQIAIFFISDGVFHLRKEQLPNEILQRDHISGLGLLKIYDIEQCYARHQDMIGNHIAAPLLSVENISDAQIALLLSQQDAIFRF